MNTPTHLTNPRIVHEPFVDAMGHEFVRQRLQDPTTKEDLVIVDIPRELVREVAADMRSIA